MVLGFSLGRLEVTEIIRRSDHAGFLFKDLDGNTIGLTQWF
jgi:hypothetical protein